jgi:hypothetical protein
MSQHNTVQTTPYLIGLPWGPYRVVNMDDIQNIIPRFSIGAIAALDDRRLNYTIPNQKTKPTQGQVLSVDWGHVLTILGSICAIQLTALLCLLAFANEAIIQDESFFSLAMLLMPVVQRVGPNGMNLIRDEIKHHSTLEGQRIKHGYREGDVKHVDILFEGRDPLRKQHFRVAFTPSPHSRNISR